MTGKEIFRQTMENVRDFTKSMGMPCYEKQRGTSKGFFWQSGESVINLRIVNLIRESDPDFLIFDAYPGIMVHPAFYQAAASYCMEAAQDWLGSFIINEEQNDLIYRVELPIRERPVDRATLQFVDAWIQARIAEHRDNLRAIAHGKFPVHFRGIPSEELKGETADRRLLEKSGAAIRTYMIGRNGHNAVSESVNQWNLPCWYAEIYADGDHYSEVLDIRPEGFVVMEMRFGERGTVVENAYRHMAAQLLMREQRRRKAGTFHLGDSNLGISALLHVPLLPGTVGKHTIEPMEVVLMDVIHHIKWEAEMAANGILEVPGKPHAADPRMEELEEAEDEPGEDRKRKGRQTLASVFRQIAESSDSDAPEEPEGESDDDEETIEVDPDFFASLFGGDEDEPSEDAMEA